MGAALLDGDLVRRAQQGDKRAFGEFSSDTGRLFGYLYRMVGDRAWAEDLTQDTFIRAHQHLNRLGPPYDFKSWVYRIAGNIALDSLRRSHREVPLPDWDSGAPEPADTGPTADPERQARQAEIRTAVWRTLHRLPDSYRQVLVLRELEGLSLDNVRVTLHRARMAFRDLYGIQVMAEEGRLQCGELNELLSAEMDGELDRGTRRRVQQHINAYSVCQRTRRELLAVSSLLASLAPIFPPPSLRLRFLNRLSRLSGPPPSGPPADIASGTKPSGPPARRTLIHSLPSPCPALPGNSPHLLLRHFQPLRLRSGQPPSLPASPLASPTPISSPM